MDNYISDLADSMKWMGSQDFASLEKLISDRKFSESEIKITEIKEPEIADFFRSLLYHKQSKHDEALALLTKLIENSEPSSFPFFHRALHLRPKILHFKGEYQKSHELIAELRSSEDFMEEHYTLLAIDMGNHLFMGDFDRTIELGHEALEQDIIRQNQEEKMKVLKNLGTGYFQLGNHQEAEHYFQQSLEINRTVDNLSEFAILYNNIGLVKYAKGELDDALEYYNQAATAFDTIGARNNRAVVLSNIGLIYGSKNQFNTALKHLKQSLTIQEELGNKYYIAICLNNLSRIYADKGNFDLAHQHLTRSIRLTEELENDYLRAESYSGYGLLMYRKGNLEESREFINKALELRKAVGDKNMISYTLYVLLKIEIDYDFELAQQLQRELERIAEEFDNRYVAIRDQLAKALMLRYSNRLKHHSQAQLIYEQLLDEDLPHYDFNIDVILNLFELLVQEIKYTKEVELVDELEELAQVIFKLSNDQNSKALLAQYFVLQSKIEFMRSQFSEAKQSMMTALQTAEEYDLFLLSLQISDEFDRLIDDIYHLGSHPEEAVNLDLKVNLLEFDSFVNMLDNKINQTDLRSAESPQMFFIIKNNTIVFSSHFDQAEEFDIKSEIIDHLADFHATFSQQEQTYELFKTGLSSVLLSFVNSVIIGYVFIGQSFSAIQKFNTILTIIQSSDLLSDFLSEELVYLSPEMREEFAEIIRSSFDADVLHQTHIDQIPTQSQIVRPLPILKNYEILLHPIRLIIIKLLTSHYSLLRSDLLELTGLNSGTLQTHLDTLEKQEWISKETEFVDNRPRSILYIEAKGSKMYQEFMEIFKKHILGL